MQRLHCHVRRGRHFANALWFLVLTFLLLAGTSPARADIDSDGDGLSDADELLAGTNPTDARSVLRVVALEQRAGGGLRLTWTSVPGRSYKPQQLSGSLTAVPLAWNDLGGVTAAGALTTFDFPAPGGTSAFFRILVDVGAFTLGPLTATPGSPLGYETGVLLSITASHPSGISRVDFLDGTTVLGSGTPGEGNVYSYLWQVGTAQNGAHTLAVLAFSNLGTSAFSTNLPYTVSIASRSTLLDGVVTFAADAISPGTSSATLGGNPTAGLVSLGTTPLQLDRLAGRVSGSGPLGLPLLGIVANGAWTLDTATGRLVPAAGSWTTPLALSSRVALTASTLEIDPSAGDLLGTGTATLTLPGNTPGSLTVTGAFRRIHSSNTLTVAGTLALGAASGAGTLVINLADGTFRYAGSLSTPAGSGGAAQTFSLATLTGGGVSGTALALNGRTEASTLLGGSLAADASFAPQGVADQPAYLAAHPDCFAPLGASGEPLEGGVIVAAIDGTLPPFEWRPGGRGTNGLSQGLALRFPGGARLLPANGTLPERLEFVRVSARFGTGFPLQFATPLERTTGATTTLALAAVDAPTLCTLFGRPTATGLPLRIFGHFPTRWISGSIGEDGCTSFALDLSDLGIPVPTRNGAGPQVRLRLENLSAVSLLVWGAFTLPDVTNTPASLLVTAASPLQLTLRADGRASLRGRAELSFTNGPKFRVSLQAEPPRYGLQIAASSLDVPLLGPLASQLPTTYGPAAGSPTTASALLVEQRRLDAAAEMLRAYLGGLLAVASDPLTPGVATDAFENAQPGLEAWAQAKLAGAPGTPDAATVQAAVEQTGRAAAGASDLEATIRHFHALALARKAALPGVSTEQLDAALAVARDAAIQHARLETCDTPAGLHFALRLLAQAEELIQASGSTIPEASLRDAMSSLLTRWFSTQAARLGVQPGVFSIAGNPTIRALDRFAAEEELVRLVEVEAYAQALGLDTVLEGTREELTVQLAIRLDAVVTEQLDAAARSRDVTGFTFALEDYLQLLAWRQSGVIAPRAELPVARDIPALLATLSQVQAADSALPSGARPVAKRAEELRHLLAVLRSLPARVSAQAGSISRIHDHTETAITGTLAMLASSDTTVETALACLEAGIRNAEVRDRFELTQTPEWETAARLPAVVSALAAKATAGGDWSALLRAYRLCADEAARIGALDDQPRRRLYLEHAAAFLNAARGIAGTLTDAHPLLHALDVVLPGDLRLERAAGALTYDSSTQRVGGAFSGQLRLPRFALTLTVPGASFSSGGQLDFTAHGSVVFPDAATPRLRFSVPARQALRFSFGPERVEVGGAGRLEASGVTLDAWLRWQEPVFVLGVAASGLDFALADNLRVYVPTLPTGPLTTGLAEAFSELHAGLAAARESALRLPDLPGGSVSGALPANTAVAHTDRSGALQAFFASEVIASQSGQTPDYLGTSALLARQLDQMANSSDHSDSALRLRDALSAYTIARRLCEPLQRQPGLAAQVTPALANLLSKTGASIVREITKPGLLDLRAEADLFPLIEIVFGNSASLCHADEPSTLLFDDHFTGYLLRSHAPRLAGFGLNPDGTLVNEGMLFSLPWDDLRAALKNIASRRVIHQRNPELQLADVSIAIDSVYENATFQILRAMQRQTMLYARSLRLGTDERTLSSRYTGLTVPRRGALSIPDLVTTHEVMMRLMYVSSVAETFALDGLLAADTSMPAYIEGSPREPNLNAVNDLLTMGLTQAIEYPDRVIEYAPVKRGGRIVMAPWVRRPDYEALFGYTDTYELYEAREERGATHEAMVTLTADGSVPKSVKIDEEWQAYQDGLRSVGTISTPVLIEARAAFIAERLEAVRTRLSAGASSRPIKETFELLHELTRLYGQALVCQLGTQYLPIETTIAETIAALRNQATDANAWWVIEQSSTILRRNVLAVAQSFGRNVDTALGAAYDANARAAATLATALQATIDGAGLTPVDIALPGTVSVRDAYGELTVNGATGLFTGRFRGTVEFSDQDTTFSITDGQLSNDGTFSIAAAIETPLPIGGVTLTATGLFSGGGFLPPMPGQPQLDAHLALAGSGNITLPDGRTFGSAVSYSSETGLLRFDATAETITFGPHFALLSDGGFGFILGGLKADGQPLRTGELHAHGTFGLARKNATGSAAADFHLVAQNAVARLTFGPTWIDTTLTGALRLPAAFTTTLCADGPSTNSTTPALLTLPPSDPLRVVLQLSTPPMGQLPTIVSTTLTGSVVASDVGVSVPDIADLRAAVCDGTLDFGTLVLAGTTATIAEMPTLHIELGKLSLPLPSPRPAAIVDLIDVRWRLDGLPSGTLALHNTVTVFDAGGFTFDLLGGQACGPTSPSTHLTVYPAEPGQLGRIEASGGVKFSVAENTLRREPAPGDTPLPGDSPNRVSGLACGTLRLEPGGSPQFLDLSLAVSGTFRLGENGPIIKNGSLALANLENLFNLADTRPFKVTLGGTILVPEGPAFGLQDARFVFTAPGVPPRFEPGTFTFQSHEWALMNDNILPLSVRSAELTFVDGDLPLSQLFAPANLKIRTDASLNLPSNASPVFSGEVQDLIVSFLENGTPVLTLDGFGIDISPGFKIPPIEDISGRIFLGGLNVGDHPNPFFAGKVGGSYNGYKLKFLFAATVAGPVGLCLDVNAGGVGIPLDATGFMISGASGGASLAPGVSNPCSFTDYLDANGRPRSNVPSLPSAPLTWEGLRAFITKFQAHLPTPARAAAIPADVAPVGVQAGDATMTDPGPTIPCPGDCPPPTVNIFCQPHPTIEGRLVLKFSSVEEDVLNNTFGITEDRIASLMTTSTNLALSLADSFEMTLLDTIVLPPPGPAHDLILATVGELHDMLAALLTQRLGTPANAATAYAIARDAFYEGLPCPDVAFAVSGTGTHAAVSSFLSITGGGTLSTSGNAGLSGTVNFLGLPVGDGRVYVAATDASGNPNPSICGEIEASFGPIDFGTLKASFTCDDCVSGILSKTVDIGFALGDIAFQALVHKAVPDRTFVDPADFALHATDPEKLAFFAVLFATDPSTLPAGAGDAMVAALASGAANILDGLNPEILMCGSVRPRLFGIELGGDQVDVQYRLSRTGREMLCALSPSGLVTFRVYVPIFSGSDRLVLAGAQPLPDFLGIAAAGISGKLSSPEQVRVFAEEQFADFLSNASLTASYTVAPMGMTLARAQARLITPALVPNPASPEAHPVIRSPAWVRPEDRAGWPSRKDVLIAAVRSGLLGNALWKGRSDDLYQIYAENSDERALLQSNAASFSKDYFPHGGIATAGFLDVPRFFTADPPVDDIAFVMNEANQPLQRAARALQLLQDYILTTEERGQIATYIPGPNPPALLDAEGNPVLPVPTTATPRTLLASLNGLTAGQLALPKFYPATELFLSGYLDGSLFGAQIAKGSLTGVPESGGQPAALAGTFALLPGSQVREWIGGADIDFSIVGAPPEPIATKFSPIATKLQTAATAQDATLASAALAETVTALSSALPKASFGAAVTLQVPPEFSSMLQISGATAGQIVGYSPLFDPASSDTDAFTRIRRTGGIGLSGSFRIGGLFTVPEARFSIVPLHPLPPLVAGNFTLATETIPGFPPLRSVSGSFNSAPTAGSPYLSANAVCDPIDLGNIASIRPLAPATDLALNVSAALNASGQSLNTFSLSPARLVLPVVDPGRVIEIYGANPTAPFTVSTTGPWAATVRLQDDLRLNSGSTEVLRYMGTGLTGAVTGNGFNSASTSLTLSPGVDIVLLPGQPSERTLRLVAGSTGAATLGTDGSFSVSGTLAGALPALTVTGGWGVSIPAGATFVITQASASFSFTAGGSAASLTIDLGTPTSPVFAYSGRFSMGPLSAPGEVFSIDGGAAGTPLSVIVSPNGTATVGTARFVAAAPYAFTATIHSSATIASDGSIASTLLPSTTFTLAGFQLSTTLLRVQRSGGLLSLPAFVANLTTPALGASFATSVSGTLGAGGSYTLTGTTTAASNNTAAFAGRPVTAIASGASVTFSGTSAGGSVTARGTVSGGLLAMGLFPDGAPGANVTLTLSTTAVSGVSGSFNSTKLDFGALEVLPPTGSSTLAISFSASGLAVPTGRLFFTGTSTTVPFATSLPAFTLPSLGATLPATMLTTSGLTGTFAGFSVTGLGFSLQRTADSGAYRLTNVGFSVPAPTGFTAGSATVAAGTLDALGTVSLPIPTVPTLTLGRFGISSGSAALTTAGLVFSTPTLSATGIWTGSIAFPAGATPLTLTPTGGLAVIGFSVPNWLAGLPALNGFSFGSASFALSKAAGGSNLALVGFTTTFSPPGFTTNALPFTGTIPSSGDFTLAASTTQFASDFFRFGPANGAALAVEIGSAFGVRLNDVRVTGLNSAVLGSGVAIGNLIVPSTGLFDTGTLTLTPTIQGFSLGSASVRLLRSGSPAATTLQVNGSAFLVPGSTTPSFNLIGSVSSAGVVSLSASPVSGSFLGFSANTSLSLRGGQREYPTLVAADGPTNYWRLESKDYAGGVFSPDAGAQTLTASGAPLAAQAGALYAATSLGSTGESVRLDKTDGTTDYFTVSASTAMHYANAITVEAWIRPTAWNSAWQAIVTKGDSSWRLHRYSTTQRIAFSTNHSTGAVDLYSSIDIPINQWTHVAAVFDGRTKYLYINGRLDAIAAAPTSTLSTNSYDVRIGSSAEVAGREFQGDIDEVALYSTALSSTRVARHYQAGSSTGLFASATLTGSGIGGFTVDGSIGTDGRVGLGLTGGSTSVLGFGFTQTDLLFYRAPNGSATTTAWLTLTPPPALNGLPAAIGSNVRLSGALEQRLRTVGGVPVFQTYANFSATLPSLTMLGFGFSGSTATLSAYVATDNTASLSLTGGTLSAAGFAQYALPAWQGSLTGAGLLNLVPVTPPASITVGGFTANSPTITFNNNATSNGLYASGSFNFVITPPGLPSRSFGSLSLSGQIATNGDATLSGTGSLSLAGYSTSTTAWTLYSNKSELTPTTLPTFNFGTLLNVQTSDIRLRPTALVLSASRSGSTSWSGRSGAPGFSDMIAWTVGFTFDFGTAGGSPSLRANFAGSTRWDYRWDGTILPPAPPPGFLAWPTSLTVSGSIGDNGAFNLTSSMVSGATGLGWPSGFGLPAWVPIINTLSYDLW